MKQKTMEASLFDEPYAMEYEEEDEHEHDGDEEEGKHQHNRRKPKGKGRAAGKPRKGKKTKAEKTEASKASAVAGKPQEEHEIAMRWAERISHRKKTAKAIESEANRTLVEMLSLTKDMEDLLEKMSYAPWKTDEESRRNIEA